MTTNAAGYLTETARVASKEALLDLLEAWLASSATATHLGDNTRPYKGWRAVVGDLAGYRFRLNADTTRAAIETVVRLNRPKAKHWEVVGTGRNFQGPIRRVVPGSEDPIPGWYCYLSRPLSVEVDL